MHPNCIHTLYAFIHREELEESESENDNFPISCSTTFVVFNAIETEFVYKNTVLREGIEDWLCSEFYIHTYRSYSDKIKHMHLMSLPMSIHTYIQH